MASGVSPISSRKIVPPLASSNLPSLASTPVATPRSMPKSSLSRRLSGTAAQFSARKGPSRRGEPACRSFAASSLPVPLSPVTRTLTRDAAARATSSLARRMAGESPTRISSTPRLPLSERFSSRRRSRSAASARKRRAASSVGATRPASETRNRRSSSSKDDASAPRASRSRTTRTPSTRPPPSSGTPATLSTARPRTVSLSARERGLRARQVEDERIRRDGERIGLGRRARARPPCPSPRRPRRPRRTRGRRRGRGPRARGSPRGGPSRRGRP